MSVRIGISILFNLMIPIFFVFAQNEDSTQIEVQPVIVKALRIPISITNLTRSVEVISHEFIANTGVVSVEELLQKESNIHVQSRGVFGVQSDISLRGSTFNQSVVLFNGVRLNDPQTAHHNFDLPIPVNHIERIEILKGGSSALYGADAHGGAINIVPKVPDADALYLKLSAGEHGLLNASGNFDLVLNGINSSNVFEYRQSSGFHWDTDFKIITMSSNNTFELPSCQTSIFGGYTKKEFGAYYFYGPAPSREWTETFFINLSSNIAYNSLTFIPKISYRKHKDKFMYDIRIPDKYINLHTTHLYSAEFVAMAEMSKSLSILAAIEKNIDRIVSTNLGDHERSSLGLSLLAHGSLKKMVLYDMGFRFDFNSEYGDQFNPSLGIGMLIERYGKVFLNISRSFRAPSYTELFYSSKSRVGNPELKPEVGWSYELGTESFLSQHSKISCVAFRREQKNLIDYVYMNSWDTIARATNFAIAKTQGFDIGIIFQNKSKENYSYWNFELHRVSIYYTYLDSKIDRGEVYSSIYAFTHPKHQISLTMVTSIPLNIEVNTNVVHKIKNNGRRFALLDMKLSRSFATTEVFIQGTNLLNQTYEELPGIPMPGRWLWAGFSLRIQ